MLDAVVFKPLDRFGRANPLAGKIVVIRPAGFDWGAKTDGTDPATPTNTCVIRITDPPVRLMEKVAAKRSGLVAYPFASRDAEGNMPLGPYGTDFSAVRVRPVDARPPQGPEGLRKVPFADLEGGLAWATSRTQ